MITHYLKIAFRNLMKYKTQSVISILGLAVGFVCFAFATLWIHYETTYDSYHDGAERMYILLKKKCTGQYRIQHQVCLSFIYHAERNLSGSRGLMCLQPLG